MRVELEPGRYVVAVSGGVDSVALLHALANQPGLQLTVAHYDHGIRSDSQDDRRHVQLLARQYGLPFVYEQGNLGSGASEEQAREARYAFLRRVQQAANAQALVTAHHQDDVLETAIFNLLRGTGRSGVSALRDRPHLRRPLINISKQQLIDYAQEQGLAWHEDSTNQNTDITRNYIRHVLIPKLGPAGKQKMLETVKHVGVLNQAIDNHLSVILHLQPSRQTLDRQAFAQLPHSVAAEVLASWLRSHGIANFNRKQLEQIIAQCKTLAPGKQISVDISHRLLVGNEVIALVKI